MKIKFNTNLVVNIIIAGIVLIACIPLFNYIAFKYLPATQISTYNSWNGTSKPVDPFINENLPHNQYVKLTDSITTMRSLRDGDQPLQSAFTLGVIGITYNLVCDTCSLAYYQAHLTNLGQKRSYIALRGWTLSTRNKLGYIDEGKFHVRNGQGYVRQALIDKTIKKPDGGTHNIITVTDTPVKFRYDHRNNYLLIPIGNLTANIFTVLWGILIAACFVYVLYLISSFLRFIFDVSKGEIFTDKNIGRLKLISISLLCFPVITYGFNYVIKFMFYNYFISGVVVKHDYLPGLWLNFVLVIIFLLLYKAFVQGKKLKEEQDLTI